MEVAIALQGTESIFVRNRPKALEVYLKRFPLGIGYTASKFASNHRRVPASVSTRGPKGLKQLCAVSELLPGGIIVTGGQCPGRRNVEASH